MLDRSIVALTKALRLIDNPSVALIVKLFISPCESSYEMSRPEALLSLISCAMFLKVKVYDCNPVDSVPDLRAGSRWG